MALLRAVIAALVCLPKLVTGTGPPVIDGDGLPVYLLEMKNDLGPRQVVCASTIVVTASTCSTTTQFTAAPVPPSLTPSVTTTASAVNVTVKTAGTTTVTEATTITVTNAGISSRGNLVKRQSVSTNLTTNGPSSTCTIVVYSCTITVTTGASQTPPPGSTASPPTTSTLFEYINTQTVKSTVFVTVNGGNGAQSIPPTLPSQSSPPSAPAATTNTSPASTSSTQPVSPSQSSPISTPTTTTNTSSASTSSTQPVSPSQSSPTNPAATTSATSPTGSNETAASTYYNTSRATTTTGSVHTSKIPIPQGSGSDGARLTINESMLFTLVGQLLVAFWL